MMEDTEWTEALKKYGIIKDEPKIEEQEPPEIVETKKFEPSNSDDELEWLDEHEDDDDFIRNYRQKRVMEMQLKGSKKCFGDVLEISAADYIQEVNKAGDGIWVVLLLYRQGHTLCRQLQEFFKELASKFVETKFLKSIATQCIPNFPEDNLPAVFVYLNGQLVKQLIGPIVFGMESITKEEVEWIIAKTGAIKTELEEDPRKKMHASRKFYQKYDSEDSD
uniref:Phosducin-like protein 3 n=1 Tax=Dermatophagoides pteronyssinus TaxID=6956 RepID=A0A6P6Y9A5_DERPT|nr:phosducin-like protein 3 [Dermatophagoides pteronyssinus]